MKIKKILVAALLIVCVTVSAFTAIWFNVRGQPVMSCTVLVDPETTVVAVCQNFQVNINVFGVVTPEVYDYVLYVYYNSSLMTPIDAWDGGFLIGLQSFGSAILPDHGGPGIDAISCYADATSGATGDGTLVTIEFHCDGPGDSLLALADVTLSDSQGDPYQPSTVLPGIVHQVEEPALVWIDPADCTVPAGTPFSVGVMVDIPLGEDLYSFSLVLTYDTAYVDCINIVDDGFIPQPTLETHKLIDDILGRIEFDLTSTAPVSGSNGTGSIAKITFYCSGPGLSTLTLDTVLLYNSAGFQIPVTTADGRVAQIGYWEPVKLQNLVELPYPYFMTDLPFVPPGSAEGYLEVKTELEAKGYTFDVDYGGGLYHVDSFFDVYFEPGSEPFEGTVASWWSNNTLEDGTRACLLSCEMNDGSSMAMGFVTNLLPPEQVPEVDPYIIVNAQPYLFVRFYWWAWYPVGKIVTWSYWWYDSHSHQNWFWKPYWWWRTYTKSYYYPYVDVPYWRPWWSWWWHWVYWRHWNWWCTGFPYDP